MLDDSGRYNKYLKDTFSKKEPKEIASLDVDRVRMRLLKKRAPQTVQHVLNLLIWIINFGVKKGLCEGLSFHVQRPKVDNKTTEDLSEEQLARLIEAIDEDPNIQVANLMRLALNSGMRRGELLELKWDDIDFNREFILIRHPKGGSSQMIPLNNTSRAILQNHPRSRSPYVFPGKDDKRRVSVQQAVNKIKKRADLPEKFRPLHGLRHVFASTLASSGKVDMYTLQKLLTHKSPIMIQNGYAHLRDDALKRASELAGRLIQRASKDKKNVLSISDHKE